GLLGVGRQWVGGHRPFAIPRVAVAFGDARRCGLDLADLGAPLGDSENRPLRPCLEQRIVKLDLHEHAFEWAAGHAISTLLPVSRCAGVCGCLPRAEITRTPLTGLALIAAMNCRQQQARLRCSSLQCAPRSDGCNIKAAQKGVPVMTREQKIVAIGSASGVVTMIAAVVGIYQIWPNNPSLTDAASRLAYTVQANAFAVIPLLLGILVVANARFLSEA